MRLTNKMREDFAKAVMNRVPWKSVWNQTAVINELERRLKETHPADLKAFVAKYPEQVNFTREYVGWLGYLTLNIHGERYHKDARVPCVNGYNSLSAIEIDDLKALWAGWLSERDDRKALRSRVMQQAACANTTEQLRTLFPDMTALIPEDEPKKPKTALVAATGIVDELKALAMKVPV